MRTATGRLTRLLLPLLGGTCSQGRTTTGTDTRPAVRCRRQLDAPNYTVVPTPRWQQVMARQFLEPSSSYSILATCVLSSTRTVTLLEVQTQALAFNSPALDVVVCVCFVRAVFSDVTEKLRNAVVNFRYMVFNIASINFSKAFCSCLT